VQPSWLPSSPARAAVFSRGSKPSKNGARRQSSPGRATQPLQLLAAPTVPSSSETASAAAGARFRLALDNRGACRGRQGSRTHLHGNPFPCLALSSLPAARPSRQGLTNAPRPPTSHDAAALKPPQPPISPSLNPSASSPAAWEIRTLSSVHSRAHQHFVPAMERHSRRSLPLYLLLAKLLPENDPHFQAILDRGTQPTSVGPTHDLCAVHTDGLHFGFATSDIDSTSVIGHALYEPRIALEAHKRVGYRLPLTVDHFAGAHIWFPTGGPRNFCEVGALVWSDLLPKPGRQ
jgi:hypothetical protein